MSLLLVAELPLFALKFKTYAFRPNAARYLFLGASAVLLVVLGATGRTRRHCPLPARFARRAAGAPRLTGRKARIHYFIRAGSLLQHLGPKRRPVPANLPSPSTLPKR
jgi:hypothetical protein